MGVLNPLLLLLGAAAAVPLLLHLLQRHQGPRLIFPALRYLLRAEKESARRIRLRQILLMLLRVAAILLLALAAARPFVRFGGAGHSPTAVVIVLDNSMSSGTVEGEVRLLEELKARALDMLEDATADDRFWLLRAGSPGEPALSGDAAATAMRIRETQPTAASADLTAALEHARAILAAGAEGRASEIHLLTDLQASNVPGVSRTGVAPPVVVWAPGRAAPPNRAIAAVELGGGIPPIAGQRTNVAVSVTGAAEDASLRLSLGGRLTAAGSARGGQTSVLPIPARAAGLITGHVEIDADALHADDRRYFAARVLPPPVVVLGEPLAFVSDALDVLEEAGRVRREGGAADVAILPAAAGAEARAARTTLVIMPPARPEELSAVNRRLAAAGIPWRYDPPAAGEARFVTEEDDPLLRSLRGVQLRQVYGLTPVGGSVDSVLLRLQDGGAWAVRGARRVGGTYILIGSPLTAEASTLPTSAAMLPLLDRITGAWSLVDEFQAEVLPGAEIPLPSATTAVQRPDGTRDAAEGSTRYRVGAEPGVYSVLRDDSVIAAYAVNPPAWESDLERLDRNALEARMPGWTLHVTTSSGAWRRAVFRERLGRELWRPLLYALLIVLLVETFVAAAGRARHAAAAPLSEAQPG